MLILLFIQAQTAQEDRFALGTLSSGRDLVTDMKMLAFCFSSREVDNITNLSRMVYYFLFKEPLKTDGTNT